MLLWHQVCRIKYQTTGGRFREVFLFKLRKGGVSFACQPLHPHNSTMESEQLVLMARAMEFQTTPGLYCERRCVKIFLAYYIHTLLPSRRQWGKYGYRYAIRATAWYSSFLPKFMFVSINVCPLMYRTWPLHSHY